MNRTLQRIGSWLCVLALCISLMPATVLAADEQNIFTTKEAAEASGTNVTANKAVSGPDADGNYTITLSVKGTTSTSTSTQVSASDIVLVMDRSGSMDYCGGTYVNHQCNRCGAKADKIMDLGPLGEYWKPADGGTCEKKDTATDDRMDVAKSAAKEFVDSLLGIEGADIRIGLCSFSGKDSGSADCSLTNKIRDLKTAIDKLAPDGGTHYGEGLTTAQSLLENSGNRQKFVIFLSDGEPSYPHLSGWNGSTAAQELKDSGVVIYTVGIDVSANSTASTALGNVSSGKDYQFYASTNSTGNDALDAILSSISSDIEHTIYAGTNAVMTDVINTDVFELVPNSISDGLTVGEDSNTLTWSIGRIGAEAQTTSFKIKVKDDNTTYGDAIPTNDSVFLTFHSSQLGTEVEYRNAAIGEPAVALENPLPHSFPSNQITVHVVLDGGEPFTGSAIDRYIAVVPDYADVPTGSKFDVNTWNQGSYSNGTVSYSYYNYDCKDITFTAHSGYVVEGIEANVVNGQNRWNGFTTTQGGITVDNIDGGSTVTVYIRALYCVQYHDPDGNVISANTVNNLVSGASSLTENTAVVPVPVAGETVGDEQLKEMEGDQAPVTDTGKQPSHHRTYVALQTATATTPALPAANTGYTTDGWFLGSAAGTKYEPGTTYAIHAADADENKVIHFCSKRDVDGSQTKDLIATVDYKLGDEVQTDDHVDLTANVQVLQPDTLSTENVRARTYDGWVLDNITINGSIVERLPETVNHGDEVVFNYAKDANEDDIPDYKQVIVYFHADANGSVSGKTTQAFPAKEDGAYVTFTPEEVSTTANAGYAFDIWTKDEGTTGVNPFAETVAAAGTTITYTAQFDRDEVGGENGGDGTPDKYQATVTYKVVGGIWNENSADTFAKVYTIYEKDAAGQWKAKDVTIDETDVPNTGEITASTEYQLPGNWDKNPVGETVDHDVTYTYTLTTRTPSRPTTPQKPEDLNTEDHYAYIIGYPDGGIHPECNITRAETATIFFRLLTDSARTEHWSKTNHYADVTGDAWYNNAISTLSNMGILEGRNDGLFHPLDSVTRAEFATIAVRFFEYAAEYREGTFDDVSGSEWYANYIQAATDMGLIQGVGDGTFQPMRSITRAEACTLVNRTLGRAPDEDHLLPENVMVTWPDNQPGTWYYAGMQEATNSHDYRWIGKGDARVENWTSKLEDRDWSALEKSWSDANDAPGGEVAG